MAVELEITSAELESMVADQAQELINLKLTNKALARRVSELEAGRPAKRRAAKAKAKTEKTEG